MEQSELFEDAGGLRTALVGKREEFGALFSGFTRLRAISYVASLRTLLALFEQGFESVELVVGENLDASYRRQLAEGGLALAETLGKKIADGTLKIFLPRRAMHTKLYLLENAAGARIIQTSANLTETARDAERQLNYAWYVDLPVAHPFCERVRTDYAAHVRQSVPFLGDLAELVRSQREEQRRKAIEAWLRGAEEADVEREARALLQRLAEKALEGGLLALPLPEAPAARRLAQRALEGLGATVSGGELRVPASAYLRWVQKTHGVPMARVDGAAARIAFDGKVERWDAPLPEPALAHAHLARLEAFFDAVAFGRSSELGLAQTHMFEALLAVWSAPFAHEWMKLKRKHYGAIDSRGPRTLYVYGPSQNGKSTFLKYALHRMAGRQLEPLSGADFGKRKLLAAASVGTNFPLVFDDLVLNGRQALFEDVLKNYWESWWKDERTAPALAISSNAHSLPPWAKSRLKRLDFDVHFPPSEEGKKALAAAFAGECRVFSWFAGLYLRKLAQGLPPPDDELAWARGAMNRLYVHAGRKPPAYFPARPAEALFDPGRKAWREAVRLRKARLEPDGERTLIHFADDVQFFELKEYEGHLPPQIKQRRLGKTLIVETPAELVEWLGDAAGFWGLAARYCTF
ncbi:MAG: phospholipase D family protein [Elusimicrobia bacterium]|nr:phospholipase D family protein [Elusimicrobiota bacterium]